MGTNLCMFVSRCLLICKRMKYILDGNKSLVHLSTKCPFQHHAVKARMILFRMVIMFTRNLTRIVLNHLYIYGKFPLALRAHIILFGVVIYHVHEIFKQNCA